MPQPKPASAKKASGQVPDVMYGDHVFAKHPARGPIAVRVTAVGTDGFRGVCDKGEKHGIPNEAYLGHKARAVHRFEVLDEGADGTIVQDASGRTRFITGPLPQPEAPEADGKRGRANPDDPLIDGLGQLAKAFEASEMHVPEGARLFLKAGVPIKNRAGLALKEVTDKAGHQTHRWQSTGAPAEGGEEGGKAPMKHGDVVGFQHGQVQGKGKIIASGADGVTLHDGEREHKVRHEHLTGPADAGAGAAGQDPAEGKAAKEGDPDGKEKPFFDPKETADLPPKAKQPIADKDALFKASHEGLEQFKTWLNKGKGVASQAGAETMTKGPGDVTPEEWDKPGAMLFIAGVKGEARSVEKVELDYGGDWSQLKDTVRGSIAVDTLDDLHGMLDKLKAGGLKLAQQPKDRFAKPTSEGYRDLMLSVTLPNGLIGELQLHVKSMLKAKNEGHHDYEVSRTLVGKQNAGELSDADKKTLEDAVEKQRALYAAAWETASGGRVSGAMGDMTKAEGMGGKFKFFEKDGALFRQKEGMVGVQDVLHGKVWKPYKGDAWAPVVEGDEVADPLGGGGEAEGGEQMTKALGQRMLLPVTVTPRAAPITADPGARLPPATSGGMWRLLLTSFRRA